MHPWTIQYHFSKVLVTLYTKYPMGINRLHFKILQIFEAIIVIFDHGL